MFSPFYFCTTVRSAAINFADTCRMPKFSVEIAKRDSTDIPTYSAICRTIHRRSDYTNALNALTFASATWKGGWNKRRLPTVMKNFKNGYTNQTMFIGKMAHRRMPLLTNCISLLSSFIRNFHTNTLFRYHFKKSPPPLKQITVFTW